MILGRNVIDPTSLVAAILLFKHLRSRASDFAKAIAQDSKPSRIDMTYTMDFGRPFLDCSAVNLYVYRIWHESRHGTRASFGLNEILQLVEMKILHSSDPRDVIYGLLAMVDIWPPKIRRVEPDYSLTCTEVYINTSLHLFASSRMECLRLAALPKVHRGLPSWVADFSAVSTSAYVDLMATKDDLIHTYSNDAQGRKVLEIQGHRFGPIHLLAPGCPHVGQEAKPLPGKLIELWNNDDLNSVKAYLQRTYHGLQQVWTDTAVLQKLTNLLALGIITSNRELGMDKYTQSLIEQVSGKLVWRADDLYNSLGNMTYVLANAMADVHPASQKTLSESLGIIETIANDWLPKEEERRTSKELSEGRGSHSPLIKRLESMGWSKSLEEAFRIAVDSLHTQSPFFCYDSIVGVAGNSIRDTDVLVRFDMDPAILYILRPLEDDLFELLVRAWVPQLMTEESWEEGEHRQFRLC